MTMHRLIEGQTAVIQCESCEPEVCVVLCELPPCPDCSSRFYRVQTEARMVVDCCGSILHPIN
jgi:Zn finger protein HypA/HybF involved in hydrogenase expression